MTKKLEKIGIGRKGTKMRMRKFSKTIKKTSLPLRSPSSKIYEKNFFVGP